MRHSGHKPLEFLPIKMHSHCASASVCVNTYVNDDALVNDPSDLFQELVGTPIVLGHEV